MIPFFNLFEFPQIKIYLLLFRRRHIIIISSETKFTTVQQFTVQTGCSFLFLFLQNHIKITFHLYHILLTSLLYKCYTVLNFHPDHKQEFNKFLLVCFHCSKNLLFSRLSAFYFSFEIVYYTIFTPFSSTTTPLFPLF